MTSSDEPIQHPTRRRILGALGAGAAAAGIPRAASAQPAPAPVQDEQAGADGPDQFMRLFDLPPFAEPSDQLATALVELGRAGGIMDAGNPGTDNLFLGAGHTFFGQFLDHDLTFDAESTLGVPAAVERSVNMRSARFDLDSVYAGGPTVSPTLYESRDQALFRVGFGGRYEDLPRDGDGRAIIGDPRNDENLVIGGLHAAFLLFHNAVVEQLRADGFTGDMLDQFEEAQRLVRWHYQWLVLHEILPLFVGQTVADDVRTNGRQFYTPDQARIPLEFQVAAYRFGHSLVQASYVANDELDAPIFDLSENGSDDPQDLRGGKRSPRRWIDWSQFFDFGTSMRHNRRIGTTIASPLLDLPMEAIDASRAENEAPTSLASRNLLRHVTWGIPSGQAIAALLNAPPVGRSNFADLAPYGLDDSTPLWFYILREADKHANGMHLGPVGGRIVAEVFVGLVELDPDSYLSVDPTWEPTLPRFPTSTTFGLRDLLRFAKVDPEHRLRTASSEVSVAVSCLSGSGRVDVSLQNSTGAEATYEVQVGRVGPRAVVVAPGASPTVTVTGRRDGPIDIEVRRDGGVVFTSTEQISCTPQVAASVATSCAAGNGRFDVTIRNTEATAATFTVRCTGLAARTRELDPRESAVVIITGRPDGDYTVAVERDGAEIFSTDERVDCAPLPADEVSLSTSCLAGNGRIDVELYNASDTLSTYSVTVGPLAARTTTIEAGGTGRVTVTGRSDGDYPIIVRRNGEIITTETVSIACDI